jgi:DASH complex subunit ASK1
MSQQPAHPALLQLPFFIIPGISPSSPVSAQIEQVDQQNTLLLQDIDANFAKFHQIVTAKILPEIKRFAIAGEPTREAAQVRKWSCKSYPAYAVG